VTSHVTYRGRYNAAGKKCQGTIITRSITQFNELIKMQLDNGK